MKYPYGIGHIYSGKVVLYNPKHDGGTDGLRRHARSQARQQARHHRHPAPVHHGGRRPRLGRLGEQLRARQGAADRLPEGRRAHLSLATRRSPRRSRPRRSPAASCGRRAPCSGRTPASRCRPWRPRKACRCTSRASSCRRTRPTRPAPTPISTPCWRPRRRKASPSTWATTRPSPTPRCRPTCRSASASPTKSRSAWSISTTATWPRTMSAFQDWWNKSFKG